MKTPFSEIVVFSDWRKCLLTESICAHQSQYLFKLRCPIAGTVEPRSHIDVKFFYPAKGCKIHPVKFILLMLVKSANY